MYKRQEYQYRDFDLWCTDRNFHDDKRKKREINMSENYFQMKDLSVGYHGNVLIHDICTEIKKGEILTLILSLIHI